MFPPPHADDRCLQMKKTEKRIFDGMDAGSGLAAPRFTIRDVLWLTAVIGLALGWLAETRYIRHRMRVQDMQLELLTKTLEHDGYEVNLRSDGANVALKKQSSSR